MTKVLLTGASGFVGSELLRQLLREGFSVRAISRTKPDIDVPAHEGQYEWQFFDLSDTKSNFKSLLTDIDIVMHVAAQAHKMGKLSEETKNQFRTTNTLATKELVNASLSNKVGKFLFLSTIKVNGETSAGGVIRATDKPNPGDHYAQSKYDAEVLLREAAAGTGMKYYILRPPLVYGENVKANFRKLINLVSKGLPLPLGSIENKRSLIYLGNLVDIMMRCVRSTNLPEGTYLVKDIDISTSDLIREIANALNEKVMLVNISPKILTFVASLVDKRDVAERLTGSLIVDDTDIREKLSWLPPVPFREAMKITTKSLVK